MVSVVVTLMSVTDGRVHNMWQKEECTF